MPITFICGDITSVADGMIAHGVNCKGVMGAGVALAIKKKWPKAFQKYANITPDDNLAGTCQLVVVSDEITVANCFTQVDYGNSPGTKYASVDAVKSSLSAALTACEAYGIDTFHTVKVGCERGGLDWQTEVQPIFEQLASEYSDINIIVYYI